MGLLLFMRRMSNPFVFSFFFFFSFFLDIRVCVHVLLGKDSGFRGCGCCEVARVTPTTTTPGDDSSEMDMHKYKLFHTNHLLHPFWGAGEPLGKLWLALMFTDILCRCS